MRIALQDKLVLRYKIKAKILKRSQVGFQTRSYPQAVCDFVDELWITCGQLDSKGD